ncbi:hypothetical protein [Scytonema sp. NUACC26]|uniref:hypothetical protein n=1 Tax=Scytonema sp. NUACC26 TaxID=3140176 RepID=UPI0034DC1E21
MIYLLDSSVNFYKELSEGTLVTTWQIDNGKNTLRLITNWLEVEKSEAYSDES